jgi:hypothetical protein
MTEAEWLACTDPMLMLGFLSGKASDRKLRLFACGCCRRFWHLLTDHRSQRVVEAAECFADGKTSIEELTAARIAASHAEGTCVPYNATLHVAYDDASDAAWEVASYLAQIIARNPRIEQQEQGNLLRDLFGLLPFRSATIASTWLAWDNGTVCKLAQAIYEERTFERLPVLADALEDAGCDDADILTHCRGDGSHVRGCWVVDLLLGKE